MAPSDPFRTASPGLEPDFVASIDSGDFAKPDVEGKAITSVDDMVTEEFPPALKKAPGESTPAFVKRVLTEGHTIPDALLSVAAAQIGQVMLTCPNALYKTGVAVGFVWAIVCALLSLWTMFLLSVLYLERKRSMMKAGVWFDVAGRRRIVTQYHEVVGYFLGRKTQNFAQLLVALGLLGTSIAQVIACAGDMYYINKSFDKRTWELIWGGVLMVFAFVPTFRHFRVLNIIALVGTTYTAILILVTCHLHGYDFANVVTYPRTAQDFFIGAAVLLSALGNHNIALEMMDAMQKGNQYIPAYFGGWLWSAVLVIPHSMAVNFAFPKLIGKNDNVYGVLPVNTAVKASVWLMVIHQWVAFALYATPLLYMWEKAIGTHTRSWWIRLPSRLPIALLIWFLGVAFPFYGAINSLIGAISVPATAFVFPALCYNMLYRRPGRKEASIYPPWKFLQKHNWASIFVLNWFIVGFFAVFAVLGIVFSLMKIVQSSVTFGVFAACYQCG